MITVRSEREQDIEAVRCVNEQAFGAPAEACLIDLLRFGGKLVVSLVAESDGRIVGHIAFSRVRMASNPELQGVVLGPMAVLPAMQPRGIGSMLVRAGLDLCRHTGYDYTV